VKENFFAMKLLSEMNEFIRKTAMLVVGLIL
jgi:hypothetical protein